MSDELPESRSSFLIIEQTLVEKILKRIEWNSFVKQGVTKKLTELIWPLKNTISPFKDFDSWGHMNSPFPLSL
ncbi:hypothetical protein ccbrp13_60930 [Ktedonobacteria bacterium brp13]|nr:hypothetical protein ccbrp13_60930 [Ktedonobacteria bacterium brp13]